MSSFRFKTDMVEDRSTKQKLSDKLASVDASLADIATKTGNVINVKTAPYNAKGDGVTDDTTAIQNAINDAYTQKKSVYFPPGNYIVGSSLSLPSNITLIGSNHNWSTGGSTAFECVIHANAANVFVGSTPGTASAYFQSTVYMSNLAIFGTGTNTLFQFFALDASIIKENYIYNFNYVIQGKIMDVSVIHHNRIMNIFTSVLSSRLGNVKGTITDSKIHHNYMNGTAQGNSVLIDLEGGNYSDITNNFFDYANTAINLALSSTNMSINSNLFDVCYQGINISSGNDTTISNNQFGKCTKNSYTLFNSLSAGNQSTYSTNSWIGIKIGAGVSFITIHNNIGYQADIMVDISSSAAGANNIVTSGNVNGYSLGVVINYNKSTDFTNVNDGFGMVINELNFITVTTLPTSARCFYGQLLWYQGKLCGRRAGVKEIETLNVTAGATVTGNITVTVNGSAHTIAVNAGDSASSVASKIQATSFPSFTVTVSGSVVTFSSNVTGVRATPTFSDTGTTGVTATFTVNPTGTNDSWTDVMGSTVT